MVANTSRNLDRSHVIDCSSHRSEFLPLLESIAANPYEQTSQFLREAVLASDGLPKFIRSRLLEFYLTGNTAGMLLLTALPEEPEIEIIPTPLEHRKTKTTFVSESCMALVGTRLGQILGFEQIEDGILFHDIVPRPGLEHEQSYASSLTELLLHTEQHFHPYSPDYVLLYCLRSSPQASTNFASVHEALSRLDKKNLNTLFEAAFATGIDYAFGNNEAERGNGPVMPVLYGNRDDPFVRFDQDLMVGITSDAETALRALGAALQDVQTSVVLEPGNLLIIDNRRSVHGRSPFSASFTGHERWLQRAKVMRDLDRAAADRDVAGNVIRTQFVLE